MTQAPAPDEDERPAVEPQTPPELAREVARGRSGRTPFFVLGGVALVVWLTAGVIATAVILLWIFL
jgi:hypothetical protein